MRFADYVRFRLPITGAGSLATLEAAVAAWGAFSEAHEIPASDPEAQDLWRRADGMRRWLGTHGTRPGRREGSD